jgi:F0F1-type ATP synthase membrane subunit c/vacuolar-type H+-ATPase subunit K
MDTRNNRIVWWALLSTLVVYGVVAFVVAPTTGPREGMPTPLLAGMLGVVAVTTGLASIFVRGRALVGPIRSGDLDPRSPEGLQRAAGPYIVCLVLAESVGLFGLVLALLAGRPGFALPFLAGAFALMVVHRPSASELQPSRGGPHAHLDSSPIV